jgi:predicted dehydrogenase
MRVGVVGLGFWGKRVAREYLSLFNKGVIDSLVLCDIDESKLSEFKGKVKIYQNFNELIRDVDAVHLCVPNAVHYELAKKALESCKHVLLEKPMTTNSEQAYELIEIASKNGCILQVGHIFRFANVIRKTKELYQSGYFGRVYYFNLRWSHLFPPVEGLDILWDLLPHPLDILNFITGEWPLEFIGVGRAFRRSQPNEVASLQAIYKGNLFANVHLSWLTPIRKRTLEIVGSKQTAIIECVKQEINIYEESGNKTLEIESNNTIRDEAINFIESIKTGKSNFNSAIIGARAVDAIEKALKSLR